MASSNVEDALPMLAASRLISDNELGQLKMVVSGLDRTSRIRGVNTFSGVDRYIKDILVQPKDATTFVYHVLKALGMNRCAEQMDENHLLPDYELRTRHPAVDCRLVVLKFLGDLEKVDYKELLEWFCTAFGVSPDRYKEIWQLADAMFHEGLIVDDVTTIYKIAATFNRQSLFSTYCKRHGIEEPDISGLVGTGSEKLNDLYIGDVRIKRKSKYCTRWLVIVIMIVIGFTLVVGSVPISVFAVKKGIIQGNVNISDNNLIPLHDNGFQNYYGHVMLSPDISCDGVVMNVYSNDCSQARKTTHLLPAQVKQEIFTSQFPRFKRHPYNYNREDTPLFGLKGSRINFTISANSSKSNPGCVEFRVFDNINLYSTATNSGSEDNTTTVDGSIDQSSCLSVSTNGTPINHTWSYTYGESQYIYATVEVGAGVAVNGNITANIVNYTLDSVSPNTKCSPLKSSCNVDLCGNVCSRFSSSPLQCIYLKTQPDPSSLPCKVSFTAQLPTGKLSVFLSAGVTIILLVLAPVIVLLLIFLVPHCHQKYRCLKCKKITNRNQEFDTQHSNGSDYPLLCDTD